MFSNDWLFAVILHGKKGIDQFSSPAVSRDTSLASGQINERLQSEGLCIINLGSPDYG